MHIESLKYFYEVAKIKSISKVAKNAHISQSALSQQIQKLEENLGYKLLNRSNKGVQLTEMGEIAYKYSENIMRTYDKMLEDLELANKNEYTIKIEACPSIADYAIPCSMFKIKEKFPHHKYELISNTSDAIKENVANDICDVGFAYSPEIIIDPNVIYSRVGTNKIVLVAGQNIDIPKNIPVKELLKYPLITLTDKNQINKMLKSNLKKHGYSFNDLNSLFEMDSIEAVKSSITRGYGIAFLPYVSVKEELYKKIFRCISIEEFNMDNEVFIFNKKGKFTNLAVQEFIDYFKKIGEKSFC